MHPLTVDQLGALRGAVLQNVSMLINEAGLLADHGHHARAYALAVLACEEAGKLHLLTIAAMDLVLGRTVNWKGLGKRSHAHPHKLLMADLYGPVLDRTKFRASVIDSELADREARRHESRQADLRKQRAIYVGVQSNGTPLRPWESISVEDVRPKLEAARSLIEVFERTERTLGSAIGSLKDDPDFRRLLSRAQEIAAQSIDGQSSGGS